MKLILLLTLFSSISMAGDMTLKFKDFDSAKDSKEYFKFDLESTAIGLLTARFPGYAKQIHLTWNKDANSINNLKIVLPVDLFDTDKDSRNQEMKEDCLEYKYYPEIIVTLDKSLPLKEGDHKVMAQGLVRGKEVQFPVEISLTPLSDTWEIKGRSKTTLSELNIKNPTKWSGLLSFNENVMMSFKFSVPKSSL